MNEANRSDHGMYRYDFGKGVDRGGFTETDSNRGSFQVGYRPADLVPQAPLDDDFLEDVPADLNLDGTPPTSEEVNSDYDSPSATS